MITAACILIPVTHQISPLTSVGGVSLLKRALLTAQRAGAQTCYILTQGDTDTTQLQEELKDEKRLTTQVVWTRLADIPTALSTAAHEHCLCFSLHTLFQPSLAQDLDRTAKSGETWGVKAQNGTYALLLGPRDQSAIRLAARIQAHVALCRRGRPRPRRGVVGCKPERPGRTRTLFRSHPRRAF